ncbi:hypothetical protein OC846_003858 [Tilletia horrida]|uniref:Alpha/beta hydrolase fold-3 domain-containing protein n=1 Tax=Tilletia horrida TaxID=155126 RepID=A0AAN6JXJ3_9BASI|nr:hypothetical protein OC845_004577 [Tilletia horrida]KAK0549942.1 hypothetical protein OC846_003858 [Tilletia horrida]KAK0565054.1 hypothetical protein OC861_003979 [Tilletia horrida]
MVITTGSAAAKITPTVVKTFFSHYYKRAIKSRKDRDVQAIDELIYDEAFHIVQKFCELATHDTVESIQNFTNTQIPTPPWALTIPVLVPLSSCHEAAQALIEYFGPEEIKSIVGGEKWWQLRPQPGVPAEWIAQRDDWAMYEQEKHKHHPAGVNSDGEHVFDDDEDDEDEDAKGSAQPSRKRAGRRKPTKQQRRHQRSKDLRTDGDQVEDVNRLKRVMLYIHGGAYYWGSINTHRHQIIRFARKFGGRAFAVNYRKAPDYPWPAPLHDCLAAYLYLIRPPPGAGHPPIDPKKLVIAGDSAGGGLCLALLGVLRDIGIPMPAGAVLISPWCDMTHSFPSILQNTATDIVPPYGFIHKPSPLWPVPATIPEDRKAKMDEHEDKGEKPELKAPQGVDSGHGSGGSDAAVVEERHSPEPKAGSKAPSTKNQERKFLSLRGLKRKESEEVDESIPVPPGPKWLYSPPIKVPVSEEAIKTASQGKSHDPSGKIDFTGEVELDETDENGRKMGIFVLNRQIQQYAANKQVFHPLCSPVMQGSLGGFPPLYILAGDAEVLRDEIIYLAHRAAHPKKYPLGEHLMTPRAREAAAKYNDVPTKVHFQLYDDQCHVLTVFAFTTQAKYAFRAIASFVKHVTGAKTSVLDMPFPRVLDGDVAASPSDTEAAESLHTLDSNNPPSEVGHKPNVTSSSDPTNEDATETQEDSQDTAPTSLTEPVSELQGSGSTELGTIDEGSNSEVPQCKPVLAVDTTGQKKSGSGSTPPTANKRIFPGVPWTGSAQELRKDSDGSSPPLSALSPRQQRHKEAKERKHTLRERKVKLMNISQRNEYDGQVPLMRPEYREFMIRERVDIRGQIRGMEKERLIPALQLKPDEIGVIKEGPCLRYMAGQKLWDRKFRHTAKKVERERVKNEHKAGNILRRATKKGLLDETPAEIQEGAVAGKLTEWEQWLATNGPTTITEETPPPSAIAGRRDTAESIGLLLQSLRARAKAMDIHHAHLTEGKKRRRPAAHRASTSLSSRPGRPGLLHGASHTSERRTEEAGEGEGSDDASLTDDEGPRPIREGGKAHGLTAWSNIMSSLYRARTTPNERREVKLKQRRTPVPSRSASVAYEDQTGNDTTDMKANGTTPAGPSES